MNTQINRWCDEFIRAAPPEIQACIALGLPLKWSSQKAANGDLQLTVATTNPCKLVGNTLYWTKTQKGQCHET